MRSTDEEIEGQSPIRQVCEVGEAPSSAEGGGVRIVPAEDGEDGGESVEGEEEARESEKERRKEPRCGKAEGWVEGGRDAEERVYGDHVC